MVAHTLTLDQLADKPAKPPKLAQDEAPPPIVTPKIGNTLWYFDPLFPLTPQPFIVSFVHNDRSITGMSIGRDGWGQARQRVYMRHLATEQPKPPYVQWPHFKENP